MNKFVVTQLCIFTLVGCASSGTYVNSSLLAPGMTKQEVISVLGKLPDKKEARGKKERYDYANVDICFDENGKLYEASAICSI